MKILQLTDATGWSGGIEQLYLLSKKIISCGHEVVIGCDNRGKLYKYLETGREIPFTDFYFENEISIGTIKSIINFVRMNKIDVIHAHHVMAHSLGLIASLWLPETAFIVTRRVVFKIRKNPLSQFKYRTKTIDRIVAVSDAVKKVLLENKIPEKRIEVIYSGVDTEKFNVDIDGSKIREEFNIKPDEILIGKIANYSFYKGHDVFLRAAACLKNENLKVKFLIVGENTKDNKDLEKLAAELKIRDRVFFAGYRRDIPEIIAGLDISVNSSRFEGLAGVIRESSSMGKPVIASKVGGNPEIVKNGETGFLFESEDYEQLAKAMLDLAKDKDKRDKIGAAGRKYIEEKFTDKIMADKIIKLYDNVCKNRKK